MQTKECSEEEGDIRKVSQCHSTALDVSQKGAELSKCYDRMLAIAKDEDLRSQELALQWYDD